MTITKKQAKTAYTLLKSGMSFQNESNQWAATRNVKKLTSIVEDIETDAHDLRLKYCKKDADECPLKYANGDFKFLPEQEKKFTREFMELMKKEVEVEPYQFRPNKEIVKYKDFFINNDIEFLLDEALLAEPEHKEE